jgi:putative component of membrane protein insertase Oxa1/YidC/SpoIIIJ protein YidD
VKDLTAQSIQGFPSVDITVFIPAKVQHKSTTRKLNTTYNELDMAVTVLFNTYKNYLSSQDINACTFEPSCSSYGLLAIQKKGMVMGMMKTFDRLARCHGLARELYEINPSNGLQIDLP